MTKTSQKKFVRDLSKNIRDDILKQIDEGKIPEGWDGHELRCLLAKRFEDSADMTLLRSFPRSPRAKAFQNHITITAGL